MKLRNIGVCIGGHRGEPRFDTFVNLVNSSHERSSKALVCRGDTKVRGHKPPSLALSGPSMSLPLETAVLDPVLAASILSAASVNSKLQLTLLAFAS